MKVTPIKTFSHTTLGTLEKGVPVDVPESHVESLIRLGHVTADGYETKVVVQKPAKAKPAKAKPGA